MAKPATANDHSPNVTSKPPSEIQTLVENHINGFNTQNIELFLGVFGDTAIIIDGIAPYRWLNPNAPANWLADVEKWREDLGVSLATDHMCTIKAEIINRLEASLPQVVDAPRL